MSDEFPAHEPPVRSHASRRRFLAGAGAGAGITVLGAAAVAASTGVAAAAPLAAAAAPAAAVDGTAVPGGSLVAYVSDVATGRISLMRGGVEVVVTDPALARTLARKAR